jgi:hypothetical protein
MACVFVPDITPLKLSAGPELPLGDTLKLEKAEFVLLVPLVDEIVMNFAPYE